MKPIAISVAEFCRISSLGKTTAFALIRDQKLATKRVRGRTLILFDSAMALIGPAKKEGE